MARGLKTSESCIYKNEKTGRYTVEYRDADRRKRTRTFDKLGDARDFRDKARVGVRAGTFVDPAKGSVRFAAWFEVWLEGKRKLTPAGRDSIGASSSSTFVRLSVRARSTGSDAKTSSAS